MNLLKAVGLFLLLISPVVLSSGQALPASAVPVRDPAAIALAQKAMAAMGGPAVIQNITDSVTIGTLTIHAPQGDMSAPTTIKTKGNQELRIESRWPGGASARIVNRGKGVILHPDGHVQTLSLDNTFAERPRHIPALSLLAEQSNPRTEITAAGESSIAESAADIISLSLPTAPTAEQARLFRESTRRSFHIDRQTCFVSRLEYPLYPENGGPPAKAAIVYSDYRNVSGVMVPFHQTTYIDGELDSDLVLSSVQFNVGLTDSDFLLPEVK